MIDHARMELSTILYQRCGAHCVIVRGVPGPEHSDEFAKEMRARFMDEVEKYMQPNACEECGARDGIIFAARINDERRFVCTACYPNAGAFHRDWALSRGTV